MTAKPMSIKEMTCAVPFAILKPQDIAIVVPSELCGETGEGHALRLLLGVHFGFLDLSDEAGV